MTIYDMTQARDDQLSRIRVILASGKATREEVGVRMGLKKETVGRLLNWLVKLGDAQKYHAKNQSCTWTLMSLHKDATERTCSICHLVKGMVNFPKSNKVLAGYDSRCFDCKKIERAKYWSENSARLKPLMRAKYHVAIEFHRVAGRARYAANPEIAKARSASYRSRFPDRAKECVEAWRKRHPEEVRANKAADAVRRRSAKQNATQAFTKADVRTLMLKQKGKCVACRCSIRKRYHADHIIPLARGGGNDRLNIQLLCPLCNLQKHAKHPIDFMRQKGYLL